MEHDCCCSGKGCNESRTGVSRRDFMKSAAIAGGAGLTAVSGAPVSAATKDARLKAWNASLLERGERRVYRGEELDHIAFPLGDAAPSIAQ